MTAQDLINKADKPVEFARYLAAQRQDRIDRAIKWIQDNDHFLFPLKGESALNHHARILMAYSYFENDLVRNAVEPIDMILHCPNCHEQHIDAPEPDICVCGHQQGHHHTDRYGAACWTRVNYGKGGRHCRCDGFKIAWDNPPHKSHLCHNCKTVWRPSDFATNGVAEIKTRGEKDSWPEVEK